MPFDTRASTGVQREYRFISREKQRVPAAARQEFHLRIGLSLVGFEAQWQLAIIRNQS
jgi:hypothetical protein